MPKLTAYKKKELEHLIGNQWLVITRAQAIAHGMPPSTIGYMIREGGPWRVLLPGVYLTVPVTASQVQREVAALLYTGEESVITGPCAVRLHGLKSPGPTTVDLLVPLRVRRKSTGFVRLHRTKRLPDPDLMSKRPLRFASASRAVADAARGMSNADDVRTVVLGAIQNKACVATDLLAELRDGPTQRCALLRMVLAEVATGIRSHAENDFRRLVRKGRVRDPMYNAKLYTLDGVFIAMVDAWWDEEGVAAEVDSREYHTDHKAQDKDRDRHDMMIGHGIFPLHFSPHRIGHEGDAVLTDIEATLRQGLARARLPIIALPAEAEWDEDWAAKAREIATRRKTPALAGAAPAANVPTGTRA